MQLKPLRKFQRITLYQAKLEINSDDFSMTRLKMESSLILNVHVQRDDKKMYIIVQDPSRLIMTQAKEMALTVKQATQLLMYCHNDFHIFIGEVLTIKHD